MSSILPDVSIKPSQQEIIEEQAVVHAPKEEHIFDKPLNKETPKEEVQEDEAVEIDELPYLKKGRPTAPKNDNHNLTIQQPPQDPNPEPEKPKAKRGRPKGTLTQQQLDNLARGRQVSAQIRKAKAQERKLEKQKEKEEKDKMLNGESYNPDFIPKLKGRVVSQTNSPAPVQMTIHKKLEPEPEKNMKPSFTSSFDYDILADKVATRLRPKPQTQPVQPPKPQVDKQKLIEIERKIREDERNKLLEQQKKDEAMKKRRQQYMKGLPQWDTLFNL